METGNKGRDYISCTLSHVFFSWLTEVVLATTSVTRHFSFVVLNDPWKRKKKVNENVLMLCNTNVLLSTLINLGRMHVSYISEATDLCV